MLRWFASVALSLLPACAVMESRPALTNNALTAPGQTTGSYFLPKHVLTVTITRADGVLQLNYNSKIVPDSRVEFDSAANLSPLSDDTVVVKISEAGLLEKISTTVTDRTADVAQELVTLGYNPVFRSILENRQVSTVIRDLEFDPFDPTALHDANDILKQAANGKFCLEIEISPGRFSGGCSNTAYTGLPTPDLTGFPQRAGGIFYRRPQMHRIRMYQRDDGSDRFKLVHTGVESFANAAPLQRLDLRRSLFIARKTEITFNGGVPTVVDVNKPSEALGAVKLPGTLIAAAVAAPIGYFEKIEALNTAEGELLKSQSDLLDARARYVDTVTELIASGRYQPASPLGSALSPNRRLDGLIDNRVEALLSFCDDSGASMEQCAAEIGAMF